MIVIYGTNDCVFCDKAKKLCVDYNLKYVYKDVNDPDTLSQFKNNFPGVTTVPQIEWHGRYIGGYNEFVDEIENTIGGYGEQL